MITYMFYIVFFYICFCILYYWHEKISRKISKYKHEFKSILFDELHKEHKYTDTHAKASRIVCKAVKHLDDTNPSIKHRMS